MIALATETSFVPGWAIGLPLLILVAVLVWWFVQAVREEPAPDEQDRPLLDDVWDEAAQEPPGSPGPADRLSAAAFAELKRRHNPATVYHFFHAAGVDVRGATNPDAWQCSVVVDGERCGLTYYEHWENR